MSLPVGDCAVVTMAAFGAVFVPLFLVFLIGRISSGLFALSMLDRPVFSKEG